MPESPRPRDQKDWDDRRACERELGVCSDVSEAQEDNEQRGQRPSGDQSSTTGKHVKELHGLAQTPRYRYVRGASRAGTVTMERRRDALNTLNPLVVPRHINVAVRHWRMHT